MSFVIRPTTRADMPGVDALLARSYPKLLKNDYPPSVLVTAIPVISRARPELLSCGTYYVADEDGALIGAGGWTPDRKDKQLGHIRHLVTDDRHLRRGVARAILEQSFEVAKREGIQNLECWSTLTAEVFYESVGFVTQGPMDVELQGGIKFPAKRMTRSL